MHDTGKSRASAGAGPSEKGYHMYALERVVAIVTSSVKDPPPMEAVEKLLSKARVGMHFIDQSA